MEKLVCTLYHRNYKCWIYFYSNFYVRIDKTFSVSMSVEVSISNENVEGRMKEYSFVFRLFNDVTQALDNVFRGFFFSILQLQINSILKINYVYHHWYNFLVLYIMKMYGVLTHLRLRQIKSLKIGDDIIEISKALLSFS